MAGLSPPRPELSLRSVRSDFVAVVSPGISILPRQYNSCKDPYSHFIHLPRTIHTPHNVSNDDIVMSKSSVSDKCSPFRRSNSYCSGATYVSKYLLVGPGCGREGMLWSHCIIHLCRKRATSLSPYYYSVSVNIVM
jgi:hypothetical protein